MNDALRLDGEKEDKSAGRRLSAQIYLSEAESVGDNAVHSAGVHLGPLELEVKDSGSVLPQRAVGIIVELWRVGFAWGESRK